MCLAVPAQILMIQGDQATADLHGNRIHINIALVPEAHQGQWVLVHAGFAIQLLDEQQAQCTWSVLHDLEDRAAGETVRSGAAT